MTDFIPETDLTPENTEDKMSYEDLLAENMVLKKRCSELTQKNESLRDRINSLQNNLGLEKCEYFNQCRSIKKTTEYFSYEDINDCGNNFMDFMEFIGASDPLEDEEDYEEDYKEFRKLGGRYDSSEDYSSSEDE